MFSAGAPAESRFISIQRVIPQFPAAVEPYRSSRLLKCLCGLNRLDLLFSLRLVGSPLCAPRSGPGFVEDTEPKVSAVCPLEVFIRLMLVHPPTAL